MDTLEICKKLSAIYTYVDGHGGYDIVPYTKDGETALYAFGDDSRGCLACPVELGEVLLALEESDCEDKEAFYSLFVKAALDKGFRPTMARPTTWEVLRDEAEEFDPDLSVTVRDADGVDHPCRLCCDGGVPYLQII